MSCIYLWEKGKDRGGKEGSKGEKEGSEGGRKEERGAFQ